MNLAQIRLVRRALFAGFLGFAVFVGYHLVQGTSSRRSEAPRVEESDDPISREVELEQLDSKGRRVWVLTAAESAGRTETTQTFRDVEIRFDAGPDDVPLVVTGDHCEVDRDRAVHLSGNVVVRDDEGLQLESDSLSFRRYPDTVWSPEPVRYRKPGLTGTADAMRYVITHGELDLMGGVDMTFRERGEAPVNVKSRSASLRRKQDFVRFVDDVRVRQQTRTLRCNDLQLYLTEDESEIDHMEAYENVDLRWNVPADAETESEAASSGGTETSALASSPGRKRLVTDRLQVVFREGGELLERARALDGGKLYVLAPEGATDGYDKELEGNLLAFEFDELGRLVTLRGRGGVELVLRPVGDPAGAPRIVTARQLEADFDPETGELDEARCHRSVEFQHEEARASAETGVFINESARLVLTDAPRLWDERVSLEAEEIRIDTVTGDVEAERRVRSASSAEEGGSRGDAGLFPGAEGPVYFVADRLHFERAGDVAVYTGGARGIRGPNRVEAEEIQILQSEGGIVARRDVRTVFVRTQSGAEDGSRPETTVTRASEMHYRRDGRRIEYRDGVDMRYLETTLRGDAIDVLLSASGDVIEEILATGSVDVVTAEGRAEGANARYLPVEQSFTVSGPAATFESAGKLTEGKHLIFFLADDRILVDGREQSRTKTTYTSKPHPF